MYNIKDVFEELGADVAKNGRDYIATNKMAVRELSNQEGVVFFLAIEPRSEKRMFLIPFSRSYGNFTITRFPKCRGTIVHRDTLARVGELYNKDFLIIRQTTSDNEIFETFVRSLCEHMWSCAGFQIASTIIKVMQKWQYFFSKVTDQGLSPEERLGLFGELSFLRYLINELKDSQVVDQWKGPLGSETDFVFGSLEIEVKTTQATNPFKVTISNEEQLDVRRSQELILCVYSAQISQSGETLPQLADSVRSILKDWPISRQTFENLLMDANYFDIHAVGYQDEKYEIKNKVLYLVTEEFPKIAASMLPSRICHVKYDLILEGMNEFKLSDEKLLKRIEGTEW